MDLAQFPRQSFPRPRVDLPAARWGALRPGECADVLGYGKRCNRDTLHLTSTDPAPPTAPGELMKTHPVQVVLRAEMKSYLPFFDKYTVFGQAIGYRVRLG